MKFKSFLFSLFVLIILSQCNKEDGNSSNDVNIPSGDGHGLLSEYNFFEGNLYDLNPNSEAGVLPYDLNMPLFSDYASKKRFVYVPKGSVIPFDTSAVLDLPQGSVLIKHFYYTESNGTENYIETRLLINKEDGWQAETYEWNAAQTDANRTVIGGTKSLTTFVNGQSQTFNYLIPNVNQCKNCHSFNGKIELIGPSIHNLNKPYSYKSGTENQLDRWVAQGILSSSSLSNIPKYPEMDDVSASLHSKARAYLAVNCSSCHRLEGSAANSGLYLEYHNTDSLSLGYYKSPTAAGGGSGGFDYVINPGHGDESILVYRMTSNLVDERMPEIGRDISHQEGVALIKEWIDGQ